MSVTVNHWYNTQTLR